MVVAGKQHLRCAITDPGNLPGGSSLAFQLDPRITRRSQLEAQLRRWAVDGVDIVQLREKRLEREKQLESGELLQLACFAMETLRAIPARQCASSRPKLLVNGRPDVAAAAAADGVHLTGRPGELTPAQARQIFAAAGLPGCLVSVSCHTLEQVANLQRAGADYILFGPVFEKRVGGDLVSAGVGLEALRRACLAAAGTPVLALGGIAQANTDACLQAGAAGVAGIRLFDEP